LAHQIVKSFSVITRVSGYDSIVKRGDSKD